MPAISSLPDHQIFGALGCRPANAFKESSPRTPAPVRGIRFQRTLQVLQPCRSSATPSLMAKRGSQVARIPRKPQALRVRKVTARISANGVVSRPASSSQPLTSTHIYSHHNLGQLPVHDDGFDGPGYEDGADNSPDGADPGDVAFHRRVIIVNISSATKGPIPWRQRQQDAFHDWVFCLDDLVTPYLAVTRSTLPSRDTWRQIMCVCYSPPTVTVLFVDLHGATSFPIQSCHKHLAPLLVRAGTVPSTVSEPRTTFSLDYIRLFLALQNNARIGAFNYTLACSQALSLGTSMVPPSAIWTSRDDGRRPLRSASEWMQALEQRCYQLILGSGTLWDFSRPMLAEDDLQLTLDDLAARCPACFGGLLRRQTSTTPLEALGTPRMQPEVIVCLDGNFQHKRIRADDAVRQMPKVPTFFLSPRQLEAARHRFEDPAIPEGPRTGCTAEVRAAIDGTVKTTKVDFDIGGVVGMTCRHGSPLVLVDVHASGEKHYYAYALIDKLLDACSTHLTSLGICYDIGCKLAVSPRLEAALSLRSHKVAVSHAVSVFHVYGHDYDCQLKYSPRRTTGFGLTDGEALERLWSSLSDLVSLTRGMSAADRLSTLSSRLAHLASQHRLDLLRTFERQLGRIATMQQKELRTFLDSLPYLVQYTNESVAQAYASTSPVTGLPARLTAFLNTQLQRRQALAFDKDDTVRRLALRQQTNQRNGIVDLSVPAKRLYQPLKSWHALTAVLRGRHAQHSQEGSARLAVSRNSSGLEAKQALPALNLAIEKYRSATDDRYKYRYHPISAEALFLPANLVYVDGLLNLVDVDEEPWVIDSVLAAAMATVELLQRMDEETTRISEEIANMGEWYSIVRNSLRETL